MRCRGPHLTEPPRIRLDRGFFARDTVTVARELVGSVLEVDGGTPEAVVAQIVEVEAYLGLADPASHAARGPTPRAAVMFGAPGHLYVYLSYGIHHCANLVTEPGGTAGAVLLRAAEILAGEEVVRSRRPPLPAPPVNRLLSGPGNLCLGLALGRADNGADCCARSSRVAIFGRPVPGPPLRVGPRVGISRARDAPLRHWWCDHPSVSGAVAEKRAGR